MQGNLYSSDRVSTTARKTQSDANCDRTLDVTVRGSVSTSETQSITSGRHVVNDAVSNNANRM